MAIILANSGEVYKLKQLFAFITAALLACTAAQAQKEPCAAAGSNNDFLGIQTIRLWPGDAPEAKGNACEDIPTLTVFESSGGGSGKGSAVIIMPSGGYNQLTGNAAREAANWFTARGFRAFVLSYRLSPNGYLMPVPLLDARRGSSSGLVVGGHLVTKLSRLTFASITSI